jgi:hypothetical protein
LKSFHDHSLKTGAAWHTRTKPQKRIVVGMDLTAGEIAGQSARNGTLKSRRVSGW